MSSEKEFNEKSRIYTESFDYLLSFEERGLAQDAFSTAWNHQQTKLDAKDKEIEKLKKENQLMRDSLSYAHSYLVAVYDIHTWRDEPEYEIMKDFEQVLKTLEGDDE